jgi:hypothetical protein
MYDPEHWDATPLDERLDPHAAIESFGTLARSRGYTVLITPHPNLVSVPGSPLAPKDGETRESAYLRSGIVEVAAANGDVIETQAQTLQMRSRPLPSVRRRNGAHRACEHAGPPGALRSIDAPRVPGDGHVLRNAWISVRDVVDGHYLSLARLRLPEVATAFLAETRTTDP